MNDKILTPEKARKIILDALEDFAINGDEFDAAVRREMALDSLRDTDWLAEELSALDEPVRAKSAVASGPERTDTRNVFSLAAFKEKRAAQARQFDEAYRSFWDGERIARTGTRSPSVNAEMAPGWCVHVEAQLAPVARDESTHVVALKWVGDGEPEGDDVLLFIDGTACPLSHLRRKGRTLSVYVFLPETAGEAIPLDRFETCIEDDGTIRIQLWTKNLT